MRPELRSDSALIPLICDKCEQEFQVDEFAIGEKVTCPYCGDVNRVFPDAGEQSVHAPRTEISDSGSEKEIAIVRTAMFRAHPFWYGLMILIGLGGVVLLIMTPMSEQMNSDAAWIGVGSLTASTLWWVIWWAAPHRWVKLIVTNKRSIRQEGIVMKKTSEVLHNHIRNVKIEQSVLQRLLGVGSIFIDSAGGSADDLIEIEMHRVPRPYEVKAAIDRYRRM